MNAYVKQSFSRSLSHRVFIEHTDRTDLPDYFLSQPEVSGDAHQWDKCQVLVNRFDAERTRVVRRVDGDRIPFEQNLSAGEAVNSGQDFDQRGLACAVISKKTDDFLMVDAEIHATQDFNCP